MKSKKGDIYTVVVLAGKALPEDLNDCLKITCTNKKSLAEITEIKYDRLTYLFTRQGKSFLVEKGCLILKSGSLYKGRQSGFRRGKSVFAGYNRNR
jgi:hypothetical protein